MKVKVLIVDDVPDTVIAAIDRLKLSNEIEPMLAVGFRSAIEMIRTNFILAAFVDLCLSEGEDTGAGDQLLQVLFNNRPTARRILCSTHADHEMARITAQMHPEFGLAEGFWRAGDQVDLDILVSRIVEKNGLYSNFYIENFDDVVAVVAAKIEQHLKRLADPDEVGFNLTPTVTADEIHYVVSRLLRPHAPSFKGTRRRDDDRPASIKLTRMTRGKSSTCVFKGRPKTSIGGEGILCIIKLGPKEDILEELAAYEEFVRFSRHTYHRVEVLSSSAADVVGGICYSFAGSREESQDGAADLVSLQDVLESGNIRRAISVLRAEFNPSEKEWFKNESVCKTGMPAWFAATYDLEFPKHVDRPYQIALDFMEQHSRIGGVAISKRGKRRYWAYLDDRGNGWKIWLPEERDIASLKAHFQKYRSCIVHGDFNGENLLVSSVRNMNLENDLADPELRVIPIDYRFTRRGPIFVDFAALEAVARCTALELQQYHGPADFERMCKIVLEEQRLIADAWSGTIDYQAERKGAWKSTGVGWRDISYELVKLARGNFQGPETDLLQVRQEYISTCLLYALRLLKIEHLYQPNTRAGQARLFIWISALLEDLDKFNTSNMSKL